MEEFIHHVELKMKKVFSLYLFFFFSVSSCFSEEFSEKSLAYDSHNNVTTFHASHAGQISYTYDPIDRLTQVQYPDGETVKYAYDYNSNLTQVAKGTKATVYSYDISNRLVKAQFSDNISISYEYDPANRIVKITYPDKEEVKYEYDTRSRLTKVCDQTGSTQYEYDDQTNLVVKERLPNGVVTEYSYDAFPRITGVSHKKADGVLIAEYQFTYDKNNNCTSVKEKNHSETKTTIYSYDKLNRLIEVTYSDNSFEKYIYDGAGNRLAKITQKYHSQLQKILKRYQSGDFLEVTLQQLCQ